MSQFDPEQLAERTLSHLNTYIGAADQKASILLTAQFAFLGFSATIVNDILAATSDCFQVVAVLGTVSGLVGAAFAGSVVYPRTPKAEEGFVFWEHILEFGSRSEFQDAFSELDSDAALSELTKQNYSLAKVADRKYEHLRWSLVGTAGMVVCAVIAVGIYLT